MIEKIESFLFKSLKSGDVLFFSLVSSLFVLLRLPSVSEPYWYGDEGIYEVIGMALRKGYILYKQIWDNKPPLFYIIYAIFNGDQFYVRLASLIVGILSLVVFFLIARKLFKSSIAVYTSTVFFAVMFGTPILEGNIANAENFMILPVLFTFYLLFCTSSLQSSLQGFRKLKSGTLIFSQVWLVVLAGFILSLSFLTKIVAVFDFAAFSTGIFALRFFKRISFTKENIIKEIKSLFRGIEQEAVFVIAFTIPIILTALYFVLNGAFSDFFRATFSQNVGYVGYGNFFIIPMGLLYLKIFLLATSLLIVFRFRKTLGISGTLILIWLFFAVENALFSQRPYTHYLLVVLPSLSLFLGYLIDTKKLLKLMLPLGLIILLILLNTFKPNYKKVIPYYTNYLNFIVGSESVDNYQAFFDKNVPRDYRIADFIKMTSAPNDGIFLWGDSAQIYALTNKLPPGRYTVSYHITFYKDAMAETEKAISKSPPRFIIKMKEGDEISAILENYEPLYKIDDVTIYERKS